MQKRQRELHQQRKDEGATEQKTNGNDLMRR